MSPPDGLLTLGESKHDVEWQPCIIEPDPFDSDDCLNAFPPIHQFLLTTADTMNSGEDELSSGLNGRLRPRKSHVASSLTNKPIRKSEGKTAQDKPKRTITPSKASPNKQDDLANKSDFSTNPQFLCPYCDKKFASKQTVSKHARRIHLSTSKQNCLISCLFCNHVEDDSNDITRHMVDSHPNQYFACLDCHTRFPSTSELAEHKLHVCEKQKIPYRSKLRQKVSPAVKKCKKSLNIDGKDDFRDDGKEFQHGHGFSGIVISCELKPSQLTDGADIEDNITTNLILPPSSNSLTNSTVIEKNAVIVLDDLQWNKRIPPNFSFHNTDADQILSRLGVVHRSPRTGESTRKDWFKIIDDSTQKFEKCFDTKFYTKVASNVQENLSKFLDGSFNFNPDPDSTIKTRKSKNSVVINTAEGFPILLAREQFSRNVFDGYMPRAIAPKHKWKWDNLESDRNVMNADQIKRDSHTNNCIITLVSSLDIWTQLCMRRKFEEKYGTQLLEKKTEKQNIIDKELKEILESREIPTSSQVVKYTSRPMPSSEIPDFPASLGLTPSAPSYDLQPAVLSGEWVRPRCYVCCACGAQTRDARALSVHISAQHPNAQVQHYEIVGEQLLKSDILKHLYVPPSQMCNRTRPLRGFRECTKCRKSITLEDLHQHMLDCAGDTPAVRRRQCRYRPFGVRKRRPRLPDNTIRKKMRKDIQTRHRRPKNRMRPRPRIRTEVGDAETIRKMIADLPAKRHRVLVNPTNQNSRPRRKLDKQRSKVMTRNRKNFGCNSTNNLTQDESTSKDDSKQKLPNNNKDDDDDNKPLKPRVNRVIGKNTRRNESIKRNTVLNRAKRKSIRMVKQKGSLDNLDKPDSTSDVKLEELSIDDSSQRIDIKGGPYRIRQHANHGGSNYREDQRPGCSGTNRNSNNFCAPTQNVPLKHSIARLTANSERHDKSVQFHHLFLVQQECNNTNQHLPSEQQTLFENEAVVTRLDKPPLNYSQTGQIDYNACQKSKLNKTRKGLNDCIAMLKNKLVDPAPAVEQISVQCGSDEPIDPEPRITNNTSPTIDMVPMPENSDSKLTHKLPVEVTSTGNVISSKPISIEGRPCDDSDKEILTSLQLDSSFSRQELLPRLEQNEIELKSQRRSIDQPECMPTKSSNISPEVEMIPQKSMIHLTELTTTSQMISNVHSTPNTNQFTQVATESDSGRSRENDVFIQNDFNQEKPSTTSSDIDVGQQKSTFLPLPLIKSSILEDKESDVYVQISPNQQRETIVCSVHDLTSRQPEIHSEHALTLKTSVDVSLENNDSDIPVEIPPAHASTNVESILTAPLDLSSKISSVNINNSRDILQESSYLVCNYDSNGTLDLSSKSLDKISDVNITSDVVVDLRVKSLQSERQPNTADLCVMNEMSVVADQSLISHEIDSLPTDLSMKRKDSMSVDLSTRRINDFDHIHDLSGHKTKKQVDKLKSFTEVELLKKDSPTDLSRKVPKDRTIQSMCANKEIDDNILMDSTNSFKTDTNSPTNEKVGKESHIDFPINLQTIQAVSLVKSTTQLKKSQEQSTSKLIPSHVYDRSSIKTLKHIYDPALIIPQYKTRHSVTGAATTSKLTDAAEVPPSSNLITVTSTSISSKTSITSTEVLPNVTADTCLIGTVAGTMPVFDLPILGTSASGSKFESTSPVYSLSNNCISVTKVEPAGSATPSNAPLNSPETTTACSSVCTLAATTVAASIDYGANVNIQPAAVHTFNSAPQTLNDSVGVNQVKNIPKVSKETEINERPTKFVEINMNQDPDIARKIAMLPKELVEILGNMPTDHRNQLLNILPQYVSSSMNTSVKHCETAQNITNSTADTLNKALLPELPSEITMDNNLVATTELQFMGSSSFLSTAHQTQSSRQPNSQLAGNFNFNKNHKPLEMSAPVPHPLFMKTSICEETKSSIRDSSLIEESKKVLKDTLTGLGLPTTDSEYGTDKIIDLTEDENLPLNIDVVKVVEDLSRSIQIPPQEIPGFVVVNKSNRQKSNNDQTASLRAVRIKAPSERNKDIQLLERSSLEQMSKSNMHDLEDNEANKSMESNKCLAIQQAEVSSTQQSNRNVVVDSKFPSKISSNNLESITEDTIQCQRLPTPTDEIIIKKDKNQDVVFENPINKSILVTSSISATVTTRNESSDLCESINDKDTQIKSSKSVMTFVQGINDQRETLSTSKSFQNYPKVTESKLADNLAKVSEIEIDKSISTKEEDSDDDVSLAVIVKQKLRDQQKTVSAASEINVCCKTSQGIQNASQSKKNKETKYTKSRVEELSLEQKTVKNGIESILKTSGSLDNNNIASYLNDSDTLKDSEIKNLEVTIDNCSGKQQEKKTRKNNRNINTADLKQQGAPKNKEELDINKENDNIITTIQPNDEDTKTSEDGKIMRTEIKLTDKLESGNYQEPSPRLNLYENLPTRASYEANNHGSQYDKARKKKWHEIKSTKLDEVSSQVSQQEIKNNKKIFNISQDSKIEQTSILKDMDENSSTKQSPFKSTVINISPDPSKSSVGIINNDGFESEKSANVDNYMANDLLSRSEEDGNNTAPLRRSKRGKSLFVESNYHEHETIMSNERLLDQKAPITKKQLIFSKLLLDEKNYTKIECTPESERLNENENSEPLSCDFETSDNTKSTISTEKSKTVKRKKNPRLKQKSKKKKIFDSSKLNDETLVTNNLQNVIKNIIDDNLVLQSSVNSDCQISPIILVQDKEILALEERDSPSTHHKTGSDNIPKDFQESNSIVTAIDESIIASENVSQKPIQIFTEKRKINDITTNIDSNQSSKPKKSKITVVDATIDKNFGVSSEIRPTTCYNTPVPARRTRSKSVVVKSSVLEMYDPYNIDLDDMIETEPFRKRRSTPVENCTNKIPTNTSEKIEMQTDNKMEVAIDKEGNESAKVFNILTSKTNFKKLDTESLFNINIDIPKSKGICDLETNRPVEIAIGAKSKKRNKIETTQTKAKSRKTSLHLNQVTDEAMETFKSNISDSDDSSKSDVPLKTYVLEKEKKLSELDNSSTKNEDLQSELSNETQLNDCPKNSRQTLAICNNVDECIPTETEEQLRSEQFMESFGFFSERKPRKSNLLATKKISETFHIIANESDDTYFDVKERTPKRSLQNENRKSTDVETQDMPTKKIIKRGRGKKKSCTQTISCYCCICKKKFRRPDNYLRHQINLHHISRLSEVEMKVKTVHLPEEPNFLIPFKQQIDRLKILKDKLTKRKKKSKSKIKLPTIKEILVEVQKTVREQQLSSRGLSRDEALFLDCCELLKESHKNDGPKADAATSSNHINNIVCSAQSSVSELEQLGKNGNDDKGDTKSDGDVDSITAKSILESEEVRNLENDLISGLKEAANISILNKKTFVYQRTLDEMNNDRNGVCTESFSSPNAADSHYDHLEDVDVTDEPDGVKAKKHVETKDKMYPDLENIDMFEDKFDKIKRKCRSQAAAAKQIQTIVEPSSSHKTRKKSEKKKGKRSSKKNYQNTVLTKGALKGFDGIKVSIPTSEINISAIAPLIEGSPKKKKKKNSSKKKEKRNSELNIKKNCDTANKDGSSPQKKVDVYEFMDNEDAELFEFRPSTLMERFKSFNSKDIPGSSKLDSAVVDDAENSSESASDDFVYMSDDYVCSDDETENSLLSCEIGNVKAENKKASTSLKRKDNVEKNVMMGKIFKHNAIRSEKKSSRCKEPVKPKANLDQLFDSLLENQPSASKVSNDTRSPKIVEDDYPSPSKYEQPSKNTLLNRDSVASPKTISPDRDDTTPSSHTYDFTSPSKNLSQNKHDTSSSKKYDSAYLIDYGPSTSKESSMPYQYGPSTSKNYDMYLSRDSKTPSPTKPETTFKKHDALSLSKSNSPLLKPDDDLLYDLKEKLTMNKSPLRKLEDSSENSPNIDEIVLDETGVARQRARRKCTVGKQNVLSETWSSESELDGAPPRPNSAESVLSGAGRKKKGKKRDGQQSGGRRGSKYVTFKKQDVESRVTSSNRNTSSSGASSCGASTSVAGSSRTSSSGSSSKACSVKGDATATASSAEPCPPPAPVMAGPRPPAGPPGLPGVPGRGVAYYWSSEGDEEQEHLQQHGWIVGDSHKKLVTMLAHAKGRKRNNEDKRHLVE